MTLFIQHEIEKQRFIINLDNETAILEYNLDEKNKTIDFISTYVPEALRGKGIAEKLVRNGLRWSKSNSYTTHATCWYVRKFLPKK